jgi:NAD(P)-dependent dehydrogenase (short-subunit alcohol dehydrogenase family)
VDELWRLDGRVALVTGSSTGLGAQFARVLHRAGAHVLLTARRRDLLDDLVHESVIALWQSPATSPIRCTGKP